MKKSKPDPNLVPSVQRQPADALGPRAQRTILRILEATRNVFLIRGYAGTTVDEIARLANVSRASIYTYFPSKRELLLAVGEKAASDTTVSIERLTRITGSPEGLRTWVDEYFELLDFYGSFIFAWTEAAIEDEEIHVAGRRRHLRIARQFGKAMMSINGKEFANPTNFGLILMSMLERAWSYSQLYETVIDLDELKDQLTSAIWNTAKHGPVKLGERTPSSGPLTLISGGQRAERQPRRKSAVAMSGQTVARSTSTKVARKPKAASGTISVPPTAQKAVAGTRTSKADSAKPSPAKKPKSGLVKAPSKFTKSGARKA